MSVKQGSPEEFWQCYLSKPNLYSQCVNQNVVFSTQRYGGGHFSSLQNFSNKLYQEHKDNKFYLDKGRTLPNRTYISEDDDFQSYKIKRKTGRKKKWNRIIKSFSLSKNNSHNVVYLEVLFAFAPIIFTHVKLFL